MSHHTLYCSDNTACVTVTVSVTYWTYSVIVLQEEVRKEAQMMGMISHPNLVRSYCSFTKDQYLWVVMPLLEGGSCLHIMKSQFPSGLEEAVIATILRDTLIALDYLHHHGHIHRDIKVQYITVQYDLQWWCSTVTVLFLSPATTARVVVADFGVSAYMHCTVLILYCAVMNCFAPHYCVTVLFPSPASPGWQHPPEQ